MDLMVSLTYVIMLGTIGRLMLRRKPGKTLRA